PPTAASPIFWPVESPAMRSDVDSIGAGTYPNQEPVAVRQTTRPRAAPRSVGRGGSSRLGDGGERHDHRASPTATAAAPEVVDQRLEALAGLLELTGRERQRRRRRLGCAAPSTGKLVLAPQRVSQPLLLPPNELVAEDRRLEPVRVELDPVGGRPPGALAAG